MANSLRRVGVAVLVTALATSCTAQSSLSSGDPALAQADVAAASASTPGSASPTPDARELVRLSAPALANLSGPANADGSLGSGCAIQEESEIPDGEWFVFVHDVATNASSVTVDVACMFGEDSPPWEAYAQSLDDGDTPRNFVISNDVSVNVDIGVDADAQMYLASHNWEPVDPATAVQDAQAIAAERRSTGMWIIVRDGVIQAVVEPRVDDPA